MKYAIALLLILSFASPAQDSIKAPVKFRTNDTTLRDVFLKSKIDVHARSVFMSTVNEGMLKDDYALASGAGLGITTNSFYGLQAGISAFVIYNIWSSDLALPDASTLAPNRYEVGLFDVQNVNAKHNLVRIENLFLKYTLSKTSLTVGKMKLNTPFLNPQDGRMNATLEEGLWLSMNEFKNVQVSGGWLWNISPRSTTQWHSAAKSIGIYPVGVTESGAKSNYFGNISSSGIAMANLSINPSKTFRLQAWDLLVDNVMNSAMIELNNEFGKRVSCYQGLMFIHQDAINNGGNADPSKTYISRGSQSNVVSAQLGVKNRKLNTSINYTHITGDGRYLMPREWGRDPFYTFMPRERNDGLGNIHAASIKATYQALKGRLKTGLAYGYFLLPDVKDYRLNKYGMPSYHQVNFDLSYSFSKFLRGLDLRCVTAYKLQQGEVYGNAKYVYNKVNMANINLILDFRI